MTSTLRTPTTTPPTTTIQPMTQTAPSTRDSPTTEEWSTDDWETPPSVCRFWAGLIKHGPILDPTAGRGNLVAALPPELRGQTWAVERNASRHAWGARTLPEVHWISSDFLTTFQTGKRFATIATNPPWSCAVEILERSLEFLIPGGVVQMLLPSSYWQAKCRAAKLRELNCHISRVWQLEGRIAYLRDGVPVRGRQCDDSIFQFSLGRGEGVVEVVRL
jgi:hypothetical protein